MALRLVDVYHSDDASALELPDDTFDVLGHWTYGIDGGKRVDRVLMEVEETESFLDWLDTALHSEYRVVLQEVEATFPRPEIEEEEEEEEKEKENEASVDRIGREELYEYARDATDVSIIYYALIALSTIVAAGGMLRDQTAVVIGAMMIAPLIGPNLSLALGTTLGDLSLLSRAVRATVSGVSLAFVGALGLGMVVPIGPGTGELMGRTVIGAADIALAAAAGAAGALSVTRGGATGLVGVMVAVALLPPIVATGLFLGGGQPALAGQAGLLTATNVVALNLAAVCIFLIQGVRPRDWWEAEKARTSTRIAIALWSLALALLVVILWLSG